MSCRPTDTTKSQGGGIAGTLVPFQSCTSVLVEVTCSVEVKMSSVTGLTTAVFLL